MERLQVRLLGPVLLLTSVGIGGCNHMWALDGPSNVAFMTLWKTYTHCRSSSDPNDMQRDAQQLFRAAQTITLKAHSSPFLPDFLIKELPSRLTVDPQAMGMACTLYAGQTAQSLERLGMASEMFNSIITTKAEPDYAYYVSEASRGLMELEPRSAPEKPTDLALVGNRHNSGIRDN